MLRLACLRFGFALLKFVLNLVYQLGKFLLENFPVLVGGSAYPKRQISTSATHRYHPDPHVYEVERHHQPYSHQHAAAPHSPLPRLMRNLESGEIAHLQIAWREGVRRGLVLGDFRNSRQPY